MNEEKKDSSVSVADQVEKSVKEKSANAENFVRHALDSFEDLIFKQIKFIKENCVASNENKALLPLLSDSFGQSSSDWHLSQYAASYFREKWN